MRKAVLHLVFLSVTVVVLLALSGFQRRVNIDQNNTPSAIGEIQMGRHTPPVDFDPVLVKPSFFDYVRYALAGGPFSGAAEMQTVDMTDGMTDLQKLQHRTDVERRRTAARQERINDVMRDLTERPPAKRGIQFKSP